MKRKLTHKSLSFLIFGVSALTLAACGGSKESENSNNNNTLVKPTIAKVADTKSPKHFKSAHKTIKAIYKNVTGEKCTPKTSSSIISDLECGDIYNLKVFASVDEDRATRFAFVVHINSENAEENLLKVLDYFDIDRGFIEAELEKSPTSQVKLEYDPYYLEIGQSGPQASIYIRPLAAIKAAEAQKEAEKQAKAAVLAATPTVRDPKEINTRSNDTRLFAIAFAQSNLWSKARNMKGALAIFNNREKYEKIRGNEFDEAPYFDELNTQWTAIAPQISTQGIRRSYDVYIGPYDSAEGHFLIYQNHTAQQRKTRVGVTFGSNNRFRGVQNLTEIEDAQGDIISIYPQPSISIKYAIPNFTLTHLPVPRDKAQALVAAIQKRKSGRSVTLDIVGDISDVRLVEQRYSKGDFSTNMVFDPKMVAIKPSEEEEDVHIFSLE